MSQPTATHPDHRWWHTVAVYQIYPASFEDSNADGVGDLRSIIDKVDYIASLGVQAVWLSPCNISPRIDQDYDISDYNSIGPLFGSIADIEVLIAKLKAKGIKLLMDLVINHTSDQHPWFLDSTFSIDSPDATDGIITRHSPNNWESQFKGSAWNHDEASDEYYLHLFSTYQPDLNWENAEMWQTAYGMIRFWLDKGIGAFGMDVISMISKAVDFPDAPHPLGLDLASAAALYCDGLHVHEHFREMRREMLDHYPDIMTVSETPHVNDPAEVRKYVEPVRKELDMVFRYDIMNIDHGRNSDRLQSKFLPPDCHLSGVKKMIAKWQTSLSFAIGAWQSVFLETHDAARSVSRFGDNTPENRFKVVKLLALLQTTLQGTPYLYQG